MEGGKSPDNKKNMNKISPPSKKMLTMKLLISKDTIEQYYPLHYYIWENDIDGLKKVLARGPIVLTEQEMKLQPIFYQRSTSPLSSSSSPSSSTTSFTTTSNPKKKITSLYLSA